MEGVSSGGLSLPTITNLTELQSYISGLTNAHAFTKSLNKYLMDAVKDFNPRVKIDVSEVTGGYAKYDLSNNTITLDPVIYDPTAADGAKLKLINHELLHALTEASIQSNNPKYDKPINHLYQMMDQVLQAWHSGTTSPELNDILNIIKDLPREQALSEFVAYGMTEPTMAKYIDEVVDIKKIDGFPKPKRSTNAFHYFIAAVKSALGLKNVGYREFAKTVQGLFDTVTDLPVTPVQPVYSKSAMKSVQENIKRGKDAMNKAIVTKADVKRAMYRNDIGWVDFVWGSTGTIKANGKTKGAMGISHIIEARMRKDDMSYDEVVEMLTNGIVETIAQGTTVDYRIANNGAELTKVRYDKYFVALKKSQGSNAWMITAFEMFEDGTGKGDGKTSPTHDQSYSARTDVGASNETNVSQNETESNDTTRFSQVFDEIHKQSATEVYKRIKDEGISTEWTNHLDSMVSTIYDAHYESLTADMKSVLDESFDTVFSDILRKNPQARGDLGRK